MRIPELLAPAGSPESLTAAVQSGADAVYCGLPTLNCRRGATNFSPEQLKEAAAYCHENGVKVYVTLNTLAMDRELKEVRQSVVDAALAGADAVLVQDWGVARICRETCPDLPLHASTQMGVATLDGILEAQRAGCTRAVLARELSREELRFLAAESPIELEVFVHGALCMSYSGHCYLSAAVGGRSGNRGMCAQPCRLPYGLDGRAESPLLSLKDLSLGDHLRELTEMGIASLKIEGRMRRPEYVAAVTGVYREALDAQRRLREEERKKLKDVFSRQGFTDGYFTGKRDKNLFGVRSEQDKRSAEEIYAKIRKETEERKARIVPVKAGIVIRENEPVSAWMSDGVNTVKAEGPLPETALHRPLEKAEVEERMKKTGGTLYEVTSVETMLDPGLRLSASALNEVRRSLTDRLREERRRVPVRALNRKPFVFPQTERPQDKEAVFAYQFEDLSQIPSSLYAGDQGRLYLPLEALASESPVLDQIENISERVAAVLPRFYSEGEEKKTLQRLMDAAGERGVRKALIGSVNPVREAEKRHWTLLGDFALGIFNSVAASEWQARGFSELTVSPELTFARIRDLQKPVPMSLLVYGRLPVMMFRPCIIRIRSGKCACGEQPELTDRRGMKFPIRRAFGCRNVLYNSLPLYLGDCKSDWNGLGIHEARLCFTTESESEVRAVLRAFAEAKPLEDFTRGLYRRGVE